LVKKPLLAVVALVMVATGCGGSSDSEELAQVRAELDALKEQVASTTVPTTTIPTTLAPLLGDHWHSIYDIYVCTGPEAGTWRQKIVVERDPNGIHTHGDGLIHIHPFNSITIGDGATLGNFFDAFGGYISDSAIKLDTGEVIEEGFDCGGQPAVLTVARFDSQDRKREPQLYTADLAGIRFLKNLEAFTIAFVPAGETPLPPRKERYTFLETVDPRALISDAPVLDLPTTTSG